MRDQQLHTLARALVVELCILDFPNLWKIKQNRRDWYEEIHTTDAWIMIQKDGKKFHFSATHPAQMERAYNAASINTSTDRTPEAIARDIKTRLLPDARAHFAECHTRTIEKQTRADQHQNILHKLQAFTTWKQTDSDKSRTQWRGDNTHADIYSDHISELRIDSPTIEQTITILKYLKG